MHVKQLNKKGGDEADDMENIPAEECRENKVIYRINTTIRQDGGVGSRAMSSRSGGNVTTMASAVSNDPRKPQPQHMIRVKLLVDGRARNAAGSVEAHKQRDRSLVGGSTQQSTPEKSEDHELTLFSEIHRNLVALDKA